MKASKLLGKALVCISLCIGGISSSQAALYTFTPITSNAGIDIGDQLYVDIVQAGALVSFSFGNAVGVESSVTQIYFDGLLPIVSDAGLLATGGSVFSNFGAPPNLPGGNSIGFTADVWVTADAPVVPNGINEPTDFVQVLAVLINPLISIDDLIASSMLNIGMHVQSIGGGTSDSYVLTTPSEIPLPGAVWLFGSGLAALVSIRRKKPKAA